MVYKMRKGIVSNKGRIFITDLSYFLLNKFSKKNKIINRRNALCIEN